VVLDSAYGNGVHAMVVRNARHVYPQFRLEVFRNQFQAVGGAENDVDVVANVGAGPRVSSLRDSICKSHRTRHCRAGLQIVSSLRDLGSVLKVR